MMMKSSLLFLHLAVIGISVLGVYCFTADEEKVIMKTLKPLLMDCIEECGLTEDDLKKVKDDNIDPCVKKCILKKSGLINDEGKYDRDVLREQVIMYTDNQQEADKLQNVLDECFKDKEENLKNDKDAENKRVDIIFDCLNNFQKN